MIESIILKNMETLKSLTLDKNLGSAYILETIDWDTASATHNTQTNLTGLGNIVTSTTIQSRDIMITCRICPVHNTRRIAELYNTSDRKEIVQHKIEEIDSATAQLSKLVNPLSVIRIMVGKFYIEGKPTGSIKISTAEKENTEVYKKCTFTIECDDPMFYLRSKTSTQLSGINGGFHFPLVIPKDEGMHFGIKQSYALVVVENTSDTPTGAIIHMKATGPVDNPVLTDVYTQNTITVKKSLVEDEEVVIDTTQRTIKGSINGGAQSSYLAYWDFDNTWLEFPVGSSLIGFTADEESYKNLLVWIELQQSLFTLENE